MEITRSSSTITSSTAGNDTAAINARWPRLLRRPDVAEYLSVSDRYVDELVTAGHIPGPKLTPSSRCVLWDRNEIDQWLDDTSSPAGGTMRSFDDITRSAGRA